MTPGMSIKKSKECFLYNRALPMVALFNHETDSTEVMYGSAGDFFETVFFLFFFIFSFRFSKSTRY